MVNASRLLVLRPEDIDLHGPWILWPAPPDAALIQSLSSLGQIAPVLVEQGEAGAWKLVAGYRRVAALAEMGREVLALTTALDPVGKGLAYLASNRDQPLAIGRQLKALRYFAPLLSEAALEARIAPLLTSGPRSRAWRRLKTWLTAFPALPGQETDAGPDGEPGLSAVFDAHLAAERLPLDCIEDLVLLGEAEKRALAPFFANLAWSRSAGKQFTTWLGEAALARHERLDALVDRAGLTDILGRSLSPKDAMEALLAAAKELRFPRLTALSRESARLARELSAGTTWRIERPDAFETPTLELRLRVKNRAALAEGLRQLEGMAGSALWDRLWGLGEDPVDPVDPKAPKDPKDPKAPKDPAGSR